MHQLNISNRPEALYLPEQRKIVRHEAIHLLAITERGTGQILDISSDGFSFGCLYPHTFPTEFMVDILGAKGSHIKRLKVRKMWETHSDYLDSAAVFELVVGVEFSECTCSQTDELNYLLDTMAEEGGYAYPPMGF